MGQQWHCLFRTYLHPRPIGHQRYNSAGQEPTCGKPEARVGEGKASGVIEDNEGAEDGEMDGGVLSECRG